MLYIDVETNIATGDFVTLAYAKDAGSIRSHGAMVPSVQASLEDPNEIVVTASGFDVRHFYFNHGIKTKAQQHDIQVMAWLLDENGSLKLDDLAQRYLGVTMDKSLQKQAGTAPYEDVAAYCRKDVEVTRDLYAVLKERLIEDGLWDYFDATEAPFTKVLRDMEFRGLPVNVAQSEALGNVFRAKADAMRNKLSVGLPSCFNVGSHVHVGKYLGSEKFTLKDKVRKDDTTHILNRIIGDDPAEGFETNWEDVDAGTFITTKEGRVYDHGYWVCAGRGKSGFDTELETVARPDIMDSPLAMDPWVQDYLQYKKYDKLVGTYLDPFVERGAGDGRIYGQFKQTGTTTGRLSSNSPNLQNIPSRGTEGNTIRSLFQGNLVVGDFSQLEPRLMAHFSQDPYLVDAFKQGKDLYQVVADRVGCDRGVAKTLVLAMSYGAGPAKVAQTLHLNGYPQFSERDARNLLAKLSNEYKVYFNWREGVIAGSKRTGFVQTIDGRKRRIQRGQGGWTHKDPSAPGRQAANAIVQGSAADIVRRVMLHTSKMFPELRLLAQVHDELVWEYDPPLAPDTLVRLQRWVLQIAQRGVSVPLVFEPHIGSDWYKAKEGIV